MITSYLFAPLALAALVQGATVLVMHSANWRVSGVKVVVTDATLQLVSRADLVASRR